MKTRLVLSLIGLLAGGYITSAAPSLQIKEFVDTRYRVVASAHAGEKISIRYNASGFYGQKAVVWLVSALDGSENILDIDKVVVNGYNHIDTRIPWTFWEPGSYYIKFVVNILDKQGIIKSVIYTTSPAPINIQSPVIQPAAGQVIKRGLSNWITWSTAGPISADFFWIWLVNESTGYAELIDVDANPILRHYLWTVPDVTGSGFKIRLEGYLQIIWDGILIDDEQTELAESDEFSIE
jgi:hypothetical protein